MALPNWIKNNTWQWIIGTVIAIAAIILPLVLSKQGGDNIQVINSSDTTIIKTGIDPEVLQRQKTTQDNTEKIIRLLEEKGYDANSQLVSELNDKIQELEKELEERARTTEDKRAEEALTASKAGNYEKARELFKALRKEEREKEVEHAKTAYNLGNVYFVELDFPKALEAYLEAVRLAPDDSTYSNEAGYAYYTLAQYDKAIEYYEKALKSDLKTFGEEHPDVAIDWNNLGAAWHAKGEYDKAIEYYEKALESDLNTFGKEHPNVATSWNSLGGGWKAKGDYDKAIEYYEKALKSNLKTFGEEHPNVATRWNNLGSAWDAKGEYDKAIEYYEKALKCFKKAGLHHHAKTVDGNLKTIRDH